MLEIPHLRTHPTEVLQYDTAEFAWAEAIAALLTTTPEALPEMRAEAHEALVTRETDQSLLWHRLYYGRMDSRCDEAVELMAMYDRFIRTWISPLFGEPVIYQARPNFRVHLPGNKAVGKFHADGDFGHQPQEYNFWLPFTDTNPSNTVWVVDGESPASGPEPQVLNYGEILTFNAVRKQHGNFANNTPLARVSWDFRVVPVSEWNPDAYADAKTINAGMQFAIGDYFKEMHPHD